MNRRTFLRMLAAIPFAGAALAQERPILERLDDGDGFSGAGLPAEDFVWLPWSDPASDPVGDVERYAAQCRWSFRDEPCRIHVGENTRQRDTEIRVGDCVILVGAGQTGWFHAPGGDEVVTYRDGRWVRPLAAALPPSKRP